VAQIARSVSRTLGLDEDLAEALALAHDLGHTPFGHAGEDVLDEAMRPYGGFDHNEQTFRILTMLERHYAEFDGLNLSWETLEGLVKHNGPMIPPAKGKPVPATIRDYQKRQDLWLASWPGLEAQVAALADDIAYNNHDIDDGLRAGLFSLDDLGDVPLAGPVLAEVRARYPNIETSRVIHETIRRLIDRMVTDLIDETRRRLDSVRPADADAVRRHAGPLAGFSDAMRENDKTLKAFLFSHMYRHPRVNAMTADARRIVLDLFNYYLDAPERLPSVWHGEVYPPRDRHAARLVADYIAGMTDRFALREHEALFGAKPGTMKKPPEQPS
jgi:dGTPase